MKYHDEANANARYAYARSDTTVAARWCSGKRGARRYASAWRSAVHGDPPMHIGRDVVKEVVAVASPWLSPDERVAALRG